MPAGSRLPGVDGGTYGIEPRATDEALAELRAAFARLEREAPPVPNDFLGPLTHDEWKQLNLRHAELHLGFFGEAGG